MHRAMVSAAIRTGAVVCCAVMTATACASASVSARPVVVIEASGVVECIC
jgi:hypothetical protein